MNTEYPFVIIYDSENELVHDITIGSTEWWEEKDAIKAAKKVAEEESTPDAPQSMTVCKLIPVVHVDHHGERATTQETLTEAYDQEEPFTVFIVKEEQCYSDHLHHSLEAARKYADTSVWDVDGRLTVCYLKPIARIEIELKVKAKVKRFK